MSFFSLVRRFLARRFDANLVPIIFMVFLVRYLMMHQEYINGLSYYITIFYSLPFLEKLSIYIASGIIITFLAFLTEAISTLIFGRGLGKIIFGVYVKSADGQDANVVSYLKRSVLAWIVGCGLLIPYISALCTLIAVVLSHKRDVSWWDRKTDTYEVLAPCVWWQFILQLIVFYLPFLIFAGYAMLWL